MTRFASMVLGALLAMGGGLPGAPALAADLQLYVADPGVCAQSRFLGKITSRFRHQVRNVPHLPDVAIAEFRDIHEHRYLPAYEDRPIGRQTRV